MGQICKFCWCPPTAPPSPPHPLVPITMTFWLAPYSGKFTAEVETYVH